MRCVDVNVLVYAHRSDLPEHELYAPWLDSARIGSEPLGLSSVVASGFLRVVTHPKVFTAPSPLEVALAFLEGLRQSPAATTVEPGERHWEIFSDLCRRVAARGDLVPDAFLAALALEAGATMVTADRGFARFPRLRLEHVT
jgi:toxin-antitoxin system PIN domain toxin